MGRSHWTIATPLDGERGTIPKGLRSDRSGSNQVWGSHQRARADGRVQAGHVHVLTDAGHHPHEELQLPARGGRQQEGAELQGLHGDRLRLGLQEACTRAPDTVTAATE